MGVEDAMSSPSGTFVKETGGSEHWLSPAQLIAELNILAGLSVAEIGAGAAGYTLPLAHAAGPRGRLHAIEWRPWLIEDLRARLRAPDTPDNLHLVIGRPAATRLDAASCDLVILAGLWHELENHHAALDEFRRILRPEGRLAIIDWSPGGLCPPGPPIEHRISLTATVSIVEKESWSLIHTNTADPDGAGCGQRSR